MTFLRSSRLPVLAGLLCLVLMGFAGTSFAVVRWEVVPSPTEVITIGRSEVIGSITMFSHNVGDVTGTSNGGNAQIGIIFTNPALQIDNTITTGIRLITSNNLSAATIVNVENKDINGRCSGFITVNLPYGVTTVAGDFIRVEGVRGRVDLSGPPQGITAGTDLYAAIQSINDPSANLFTPDIVRVAKTLCPYFVTITKDTLLLCFPPTGKYTGSPTYSITITEGFARAFVDANSNGTTAKARVDSSTALLGAPTTNTSFTIYLRDIPASVASITWPASVAANQATVPSFLVWVSNTSISSTGEASAVYRYVSNNQTDLSDITTESFTMSPVLNLGANAIATGTVNAGVYLYPYAETLGACDQPATAVNRPRFVQVMRSLNSGCNIPPSEPVQPYADIIRCNCYLLFTYVTSTSTWNTGMVVANTSGDTAVFGSTLHAPDQQGPITFYFYDKSAQFVGSTTTTTDILPGQSYVNVLSAMLPTTPTAVTTFSGYVVAKTSFQYCHGYAFIADNTFANIAQGYLANVIPDPSIKGTYRTATAAADVVAKVPAGESLNN
jgi:hypothetical protein